MTQNLMTQRELSTVVHLLARSVQTNDNMQAFLTAWAALEVFLSKTFKAVYEEMIYGRLVNQMAPSEHVFIARLREVIRGKYNIKDKFVVIASALAPFDADTDIELFKKLKEERDGIHTMSLKSGAYSAAIVQNLVRKYLRLHLVTKRG